MDIENVKSFADIKTLDEAGLVMYAKEIGGVDLDPKSITKEQMLSKCASIFLSKKSTSAGVSAPKQLQPALPLDEMEDGKAEKLPLVPVQPKEKKRTKAQIKADEAEAQRKIKEHREATDGSQDYPRCSVCSVAITIGGGQDLTTGKPLCKDCLTKTNHAKENAMNAKTNTKKAAAKKDSKKTVSTKTGKKAVAKKEPAAADKYGFREGSKGSLIFAALIKGATKEELAKVGGNAVAGFLAGIVKNPKDWSAGRSVKWVKSKKENGIYKIESWNPKA